MSIKVSRKKYSKRLWNSRLDMVIAVITDIAVAIMMFYIATTDVRYLIGPAFNYALSDAYRRSAQEQSVEQDSGDWSPR